MTGTLRNIGRRCVALPAAALVLVAFISVPAGATPVAHDASGTTAHPTARALSSMDWQFLTLTNQARAQAGLGPLAMVPGLANNALGWSQTMAAQQNLYHCSCWASQITSVDPNWTNIGQNIGFGYDPASMQASFMNSAPHRANILGAYRFIGIGADVDGAGRIWVTVNFLNATDNPGTVQPPPTNLPPAQGASFWKATFADFLHSTPPAAWLSVPVSIDQNARMLTVLPMTRNGTWTGPRINALYESAFGRPADPVGLAGWTSLIANGLGFIDTAGSVYSSPEFWARNGSNVTGWVTGLYQAILHRLPDPTGLAGWVNWVSTGQLSLMAVARDIYQSPENRAARVAALYPVLLGRPADPAGLAGWTAWLGTNDDLLLAAALGGSAEYLSRAIARHP